MVGEQICRQLEVLEWAARAMAAEAREEYEESIAERYDEVARSLKDARYEIELIGGRQAHEREINYRRST